MNFSKLLFILVIFSIISCKKREISHAQDTKSLLTYVNPFIGTGGHGHTYPGATTPFGMMQLSPDTRLDGWDGCSGYHYSDEYIYGFSHTHLSGTGVSDYGDILLMPTNKVTFNNGADGEEGYRSKFSHDKEKAEPGFYKVHLDDTDIDVELTVAKRSGMHKYQFPSAENQVIVLDLEHRDQLLNASLEIVSNTEFKGSRSSKAWATNQKLFYSIQLSHPIDTSFEHYAQKNAERYAFKLVNPNNEPVYVKIGISAVDIEGAKKNLAQEIGNKTFSTVKKEAQKTWEKQLRKIVVESDNEDYKVNFYTSMYHTMIAPNLYQDVDGRYRGMDLKIHETKDFDYYTVFSLWDTYRATHPLYTIIEQDRTNDFINTFLAKYDEGGIMPIWDLSANYTGCMIGYHAVPVIADAYLKGIKDYDAEKALLAMKHSATRDKLGLKSYKSLGYIPVEEESESVSKTLEYAYDDWTIAQMAKQMGKEEDYKEYIQRAQYYKNIFDPKTQFMRGRFRNTWFAPFDPYEVNFNYTEANAWQYSNYVPQDVSGYIKLLGGVSVLEKNLDTLFAAESNTSGRHQKDITGLIGQYAHGNEPSHHMAYLYNYVGKPSKTQEKIYQILTEQYTNAPDGISGNEDCGQMSAWYIFSSLGFYPVTPGSNEYIIGTPLLKKATIHLENGKTFTVVAEGINAENKYIKNARLNGKTLDRTFISHEEIVNGGSLEFEMTNSPSNWGTQENTLPKSSIEDHLIVPAPFIEKGEVAFKGNTQVVLANADTNAEVYFKLNDGEFKKYEQPIQLSEKTKLSAYSKIGETKSAVIKTNFVKIDPNIKISLETAYANQYNAGGDHALIDGIKGARDFRTGTWQGYSNVDVVATVDLGKEKWVESISTNYLEDQRSWIFLPTSVSYYTSVDGKTYKQVADLKIDSAKPKENTNIKEVTMHLKGSNVRYVKVVAKKLGDLPEWHLGYKHNGKSWIFIDEIMIK
ncbi:GH92 family glycosyl hydrolase [Tenacibaculum jejuense]|uniref:Probable lipoprotein. Glycoside hydrolase, family 92 n=1 Tax=Tenacibaculum jejuense TaxID=584609 RepID=A0A238U8M7_9FLAO|nr:GH92 family glycosyl hydrolase [Tenacibaculum jejuense]SNR15549.1 Probable lipoprotein precursor. Glycoside hydrolase, family 92 [Tenacibaculum jejuense]